MTSPVKERASQVGTGVFLIGLAVLFLLPDGQIWPHIMFVIAASLLATEYSEFHTIDFRSQRVISAVGCALIGVFFVSEVIFNLASAWPVLLIAVGLFMIFGNQGGKRKNG